MWLDRDEYNKLTQERDSFKKQLATEQHDRRLEREKMAQEKRLAVEEKAFEMKHFKDAELKKATTELQEEKQKVAVLIKENEMLGKIVDVNKDIAKANANVLDIRAMFSDLIKKLPSIDLKNLSVNLPALPSGHKD